MRKASRAAIVDRAELLVRACQTSRRRLTKIDLAHADFVDVRDVVQVKTMRAIIFERDGRFAAQLPLERCAPELRLRYLNILRHIARTHGRQDARFRGQRRAGCSGKGSEITYGDRHDAAADVDSRIVWRILDHIKGDVSKVPFIGDAVSAPKAGLSVTKH